MLLTVPTQGAAILAGFGTFAFLGLLAGLASRVFPRAPTIAAGLIAGGYVSLLAMTVVWTAVCPTCTSWTSEDSARGVDIFMAFFWGGLSSAAILAIIWSGTRIARLPLWSRRR